MSAFDNNQPIDRPLPVGQNTNNPNTFQPPIFQPTYANLGTIQSLVLTLQNSLLDLGNQLTETMNGVALPVTASDTTIAAAVAVTWPSSLGSPPNYVTFNYYNYLLGLNSSAATLITNAYLSAAQDVGGNNAIDLFPIVQILTEEINYVSDFIANNLSGGINDSSEQRTAELFQDILTSANTQVQNAQNIFQNQSAVFSPSEVAQLSQGDAQNAQALFQVNLNKLNIQLNQDIHVLNTNFASSAQTFYQQFLEPALQFRQNVSSQMLPIFNGTLGMAISSSINSTNQDLHNTLVDQQNRLTFLATQVDQIMSDIINRDAYRDYINQLAPIGTPVPSGISGQMIQAHDSSTALTFFQNAAAGIVQLPAATPSFDADHQALSNRLDFGSHPQYLTIEAYNSATPNWFDDIDSSGGTLDLSNYVTILGISLTDTSSTGIQINENGNSPILIQNNATVPWLLEGGILIWDGTIDGIGLAATNPSGSISLSGAASVDLNVGTTTLLNMSSSILMEVNNTGHITLFQGSSSNSISVQEAQINIEAQGSSNISMITTGTGEILLISNNGIFIESTGSSITLLATQMGFFDKPPINKPTITGSKGANAALASLLTQLANLGLVIDSTS